MRGVAEANRDTYVDFSPQFEGHDACQPASERWVQGVLTDVPVFVGDTEIPPPPLSLIPGSPYMEWLENYAAQRQPLWAAAHPNAEGHLQIANVLHQLLGKG